MLKLTDLTSNPKDHEKFLGQCYPGYLKSDIILLKVARRMENVYQPHCWNITNNYKEVTELKSRKRSEFY